MVSLRCHPIGISTCAPFYCDSVAEKGKGGLGCQDIALQEREGRNQLQRRQPLWELAFNVWCVWTSVNVFWGSEKTTE